MRAAHCSGATGRGRSSGLSRRGPPLPAPPEASWGRVAPREASGRRAPLTVALSPGRCRRSPCTAGAARRGGHRHPARSCRGEPGPRPLRPAGRSCCHRAPTRAWRGKPCLPETSPHCPLGTKLSIVPAAERESYLKGTDLFSQI